MSDYKYELERDERHAKESESEMARLDVSPQDISKFQDWIKAKELSLINEVKGEYLTSVSKQTVRLVIAILVLELQKQAEMNMDEMSRLIQKEA